mmetsp:Transcript_3763/g.9480  ORF Transcript_3763/g.9480 Transcript_3763/m.9480 type:complete len:435 (+) Transcript_3763:147-1451(+)
MLSAGMKGVRGSVAFSAVLLLALCGLDSADALLRGGAGLPLSSSPALSSARPAQPSSLLRPERTQALKSLRGGHGAVENSGQGQGTPLELLICVSGIYFCYLYYGVLQEDLLTSTYGSDAKSFKEVCSVLFLQAVQCTIGAVFARLACLTTPQPATGWQTLTEWKGLKQTLWPLYMQVGFCYILAMFFSNSALFFINYPTQVIVKSCKMIPVMAVSVLWRKKKYPLAAYLRVLMVTMGIISFTFFKKSSKAKAEAPTQVVGLVLAFASLLMDGFVGPAQEEIFSRFKSSTHQMMYYTNMWAMLLLIVALLVTGDGKRALEFVFQHPAVLSKIMQFGLMSATGQFFIFFLVRSFSALTLVTVTTTRKFFTVLASIFWFKHALTTGQWASVGLVFVGLGWEETSKYLQKMARRGGGDAAAPKVEAAFSSEAPQKSR